MSTHKTEAEAIEHAYDTGRWVQARCDAERCIAIYDLPEAKLRPVAAWSLLPLGLEVSGARKAIASSPIEDEEMQALWPEHRARLEERLTRVIQQHELWNSQNVTRN